MGRRAQILCAELGGGLTFFPAVEEENPLKLRDVAPLLKVNEDVA